MNVTLGDLPLELKIAILVRMPYESVRFFTSRYFWSEYWKHNSVIKGSADGVFTPNKEQAYVLDLVNQKKNIFINSPAGTGKSTLLKYIKQCHSDKVVGLTSTTGISALNIQGSTLHSFLGIGLGADDVDALYDKIMKNEIKKKLWCVLDMLIVDEVSMLHPDLFKKLEKLGRRIRGNKLRFGGVQLIVAGDLFQLPCVSTTSTLVVVSSTFKKCIDEIVELRYIMRQDDPSFKEILNKVRVGDIDEDVVDALSSRFVKVPKTLKLRPTMLFCTRDSVDELNNKELDRLASKGCQFYEYEMNFQCCVSLSMFNYAKSNFCKNSTTPQILSLTKQVQVMLTHAISATLVNGSRGIVVDFEEETGYPIVQFLDGQTMPVRPVKFTLCDMNNGRSRNIGYAVQVPLKVAYALTVHACQGSTLDYVKLDLGRTFEYGQVYTALSRVKSLDGLFIKKFDFGIIQAHPEALRFMDKNM
jgi:ATP-dependent DNA helicase PIF1